ncbi:MAG: nickel pincer cofactor biosynthesis protein LarC [Phycisphaerae bacterium]|nr:nickel pincer cofactor biosynthesis protein LarC [Phycisphaerae bacterium]
MNIAYFDCFAGAGGDMIVAAMLDAGVDRQDLISHLTSLPLGPVHYQIDTVMRKGISATHFEPQTSSHASLDWDDHTHSHAHNHGTPHSHHPHENPSHSHTPSSHSHQSLSDIRRLILDTPLPTVVKNNALAIFDKLGRVEAAIHNKPVEEIHFHEVGAMDSIVDIVAACICFDALKIERVVCSPFAVGSGTLQCAHGILPVPAPATAELLRQAKAPLISGPGNFELLTPTAAAILTHFASSYGPIPSMTLIRIGYGAGSRDAHEFPNVLRVAIGQSDTESADTDSVILLECNIDDVSAEQVGQGIDLLLKAGALDVFTSPIQMKNNRPAILLSVIAEPSKNAELEGLIFRQGLTLGIRKQILQRSILPRQVVTIETEYGPIRVKTGYYDGRRVFLKPEYADCVQAAEKHKVSWVQVWQETLRKTPG